jgi:hypothetical protein
LLDVPTASGAWAAPETVMYQRQLANQPGQQAIDTILSTDRIVQFEKTVEKAFDLLSKKLDKLCISGSGS